MSVSVGKANFLTQIATNDVGLVFEYPSGLTGFTIQELPWAKNAIFMVAVESNDLQAVLIRVIEA